MPGRSKTEEKNIHVNFDLKSLAECRECTCFNLRKATRAVTQVYDDAMRPAGLRVTQFTLLAYTYAIGPVPLTKLADAMVTDRTTLARNLEPLVKEGFLSIENGKDRRSRIISITDDGLGKLTEAYPLWKRTQDDVKKKMGQDNWSSMISHALLLVDRTQGK